MYPWGDQHADCTRANFIRGGLSGNYFVGDTSQVGVYPMGASPYGAMDRSGNVWEWVNDRYDADYYYVSPYNKPPGPGETPDKVLRGGGWSAFLCHGM